LGRITVHSEYSFGLFKSWSKLAFAQRVIVYPKPKQLMNKHHQLSSNKEEQGENNQQQEYTIRFRTDEMLHQLFHPPTVNREADNMNRLFCE
jgi:hypothetical protein